MDHAVFVKTPLVILVRFVKLLLALPLANAGSCRYCGLLVVVVGSSQAKKGAVFLCFFFARLFFHGDMRTNPSILLFAFAFFLLVSSSIVPMRMVFVWRVTDHKVYVRVLVAFEWRVCAQPHKSAVYELCVVRRGVAMPAATRA